MAIKSLSSRSGQTIYENIQKAARQIDAPACPASRGLVVINLTHSLSQEKLWGQTYASEGDALAAMSVQMEDLIRATETDRPLSEWESVFANRTSPLVFYYAHAVVRVNLLGRSEVPTILKKALVTNPLNRLDRVAASIADSLNEGIQRILLGVPGTIGRASS